MTGWAAVAAAADGYGHHLLVVTAVRTHTQSTREGDARLCVQATHMYALPLALRRGPVPFLALTCPLEGEAIGIADTSAARATAGRAAMAAGEAVAADGDQHHHHQQQQQQQQQQPAVAVLVRTAAERQQAQSELLSQLRRRLAAVASRGVKLLLLCGRVSSAGALPNELLLSTRARGSAVVVLAVGLSQLVLESATDVSVTTNKARPERECVCVCVCVCALQPPDQAAQLCAEQGLVLVAGLEEEVRCEQACA